ncbi:DUF5819 family protein [Saxibacter everestensis]|uniref:DUF5819 family protein n=1 Tax=Saxibacter everestensis TaxID=2909229 RepID=A0ABY8R081_9MICO|nr:DUF5819 family protein [Brevibacteriaceae bacterium ZFBP1038]
MEMQRNKQGPAQVNRPWYVRIIALALALVLSWHLLATFIWSSGSSPIRDAVGTSTVKSYMLPMFSQSWSVFAPDPIRSNSAFEVRARTDSGKLTTWYSISSRDIDQAIRYHAVPSRLYLTNFQLATHYRSAFGELSAEEQDAVAARYEGDGWHEALKDRLSRAGKQDKLSADGSELLANDIAVTRLASEIAVARWGAEVQSVQVRFLNQAVRPYSQRANPDFKTRSSIITPGWRPIDRVEGLDTGVIQRMYGDQAEAAK